MKSKKTLFTFLAWLQLTLSALLAVAIIWGYVNFQASFGQFPRSLATSISAMSDAVIRTAETVEARQAMLNETQQVLVEARKALTDIKAATQRLVSQGTQLTREINATSEVLIQVAGPLQTMGDTLRTLSVPNIQIVGIKPVVSITRPFEDVGKKFMGLAMNLKSINSTFAKITESINQDGPKVGTDLVTTSEQAMKALIETEKTLERLKSQDLPKAIENLKATSENLRNLSTQVESVSNVGPVLLLVGLLLALWCFIHSLGALLLARSQSFGLGAEPVTAAINS
jgi:septal ring factor EnvC (AmiA/AmiB activator)